MRRVYLSLRLTGDQLVAADKALTGPLSTPQNAGLSHDDSYCRSCITPVVVPLLYKEYYLGSLLIVVESYLLLER